MTEPVHEVNPNDIVFWYGSAMVELNVIRAKLAARDARIKELEDAAKKAE